MIKCWYIFLLCLLIPLQLVPAQNSKQLRKANTQFQQGAELFQLGDYAGAIPLLQTARELYELQPSAYDNSAYAALWKGMAYYYLFEYENAIPELQAAIEKAEIQNIKEITLSATLQLANTYYAYDLWSQAYELYKSTLVLMEDYAGTEYYPGVYEGLGNIDYAWGKYDSAENFYLLALDYATRNRAEESIISLQIALGKVHHARYDMDRAIETYLRILNRPGLTKSRFYGSLLNSLGIAYFQKNEPDTALEYYHKALKIAKDLQNVIEELRLLIHIGGALHIKGEYSKALEFYQRALPLAEANRRIGDASVCLFNIGVAYNYLEDYNSAIPYFLRAIENKEELRLSASGKDRLDYLAAEVHVYQWLATTYLLLENFEETVNALEFASTKYLREQLQENREDGALKFSGVLNYQKNLSEEQAILNFGSSALPWHSIINITQNTIDGTFALPEDILAQLSDQTFKHFKQLESSRRGITFSKEENFEEPSLLMSFDDLIKYYRMLLSYKADSQLIREIGRLLYDYLIGPVEEYIKDKKHLIFIPDGILAFLPFETLTMPDGRYLIEQYDISYVQSLAVSELINKRNYPSDRMDLLGIGGAHYQVSSNTQNNSVYNSLVIGGWQDLPGTLEEIRNISTQYPGSDLLTGDDASESLIKSLSAKNELRKYKIIHFATHGFVLPEQPDLSAIVLSQNNPGNNDGYLNVAEIANLNFEADFVNLSACETGLGKIYGGEGVVGLSQAFLIAGANSMSVSLWQVADASTRDFMTGFYELTKTGLPFYVAIAEMKRFFIDAGIYDHPFYWAPFVFYGK
jgi:CHAT domain-containing protein